MKKFSISLLVFCLAVKAFASGHVATAIGVNPTCHGQCTGTATAMASGGIGPYGFTWTGPSSYTGAGANISGLCAGVYIVTATDSSDMSTAVYTLNLTEPSLLLATASGGTICAGAPLPLNSVGSGGTPSYSYLWSPATGLSNNAIQNPVASPVTTTTYTLMVTDAAGCTTTTTATVTVNPNPVITLMPNPSTCGACNGSITVNAPGATTYNWTGGSGFISTSPNLFGLCMGTYTLTVTSGMGCSAAASTTIWSPPPVVGTVTVTPSSCGACNGTATVLATGGTPPYTYTWPGGMTTTATETNLCPGTYTMLITDASGCTFPVVYTITNSSSMAGAISSTPTSCGGICNGSANVTVSGGTAPYIYDWSPGSPTGDSTASVSDLCLGTYSVTVTDAAGCTYFGNVTIVNSTPIVVTASSTTTVCGTCNATVTMLQSGGTGPYIFDLNDGSPTQTNGNFSGICPGTYTSTVTDVNGCVGSYTVAVTTTSTATFGVNPGMHHESAAGMSDGYLDLTVSGTTGPYTFSWSNGATTEDLYSLTSGPYTVTVTDSNGDCAMYTYTIGIAPAYGYITGYVFNDNNSDCSIDGGDMALHGYYVTATNGASNYWGYTNYAGYYSILVPTGNYTVTPNNPLNLGVGCTSTYSVTAGGGLTYPNINFMYENPPLHDVCVSVWANAMVPGFSGYYAVSVNNIGNQPATGVVYLVLPAVLDYVSASPAPSSISGDTIFWNYTNIPAYSGASYSVVYNTPVGTLGTPTVTYVHATLTSGTDANPACNTYVYTRVITGSYDPNDKTVSPAGVGVTGDIPLSEDEFTYLIRFQNTGSGPAVNIYVTDTLSSLLDPMSFQMLNASHAYTVEMMPGNVLRWQFDSIMLVDSTTNEAASHGHIQFRISKLNAPVAGQVIENSASIYFDFNEPVITNTAVNTYSITTGVDGIASDNGDITVYPNPFSDNTTFMIRTGKTNETYTFEMTDVLGKTVRLINGITEKQFSVSRAGLENGIYFYKIYSGTSLTGIGKVVIK